MKTSTLGKGGKKTPAYSPTKAKKASQHSPAFLKKQKEQKSLIKKVALDYKAKNMNAATANKAGRAVAGMITQSFGRYNHTKA